MKKILFFTAAAAIVLLAGCKTPPEKFVNWNLPDKFDFGSMKDTVHVQISPVNIHSADLDRESAEQIRQQFSSIAKNKFIGSKRFTIVETNKAHQHNSDISVTSTLQFPAYPARSYMVHTAALTSKDIQHTPALLFFEIILLYSPSAHVFTGLPIYAVDYFTIRTSVSQRSTSLLLMDLLMIFFESST